LRRQKQRFWSTGKEIFAYLAARTDNLRNLEETFAYDHLNRLTDVWLNNVHTGHMAYDALGRMTDKRTDGQQVFSSAQHDYVGPDGQLRPHAISSATVEDNPFPTAQQSITYTMFDKVRFINANTGKTLGYAYGYNHQRTMLCETVLSVTRMKHYVGNCEFVMRIGSQQELTYLSGPMGVFAVVEKENGAENIHYIYKDHLGSWTTITDANGTVEREQSFDAWGNMRNPDTWTNYTAPEPAEGPMFDRGYTGHEHLNAFGLINMNGRMYDPVMSSFLSVDNYVQAPDFSQNFNRYAYCLNNPLRYTDPDGEWVQYVIGGVLGGINGYSIGKAAGLEGWDLAWATIGGAAVGAATVGIGTGVSSAFSNVAVGTIVGGAASGAVSGGVFGMASAYATGARGEDLTKALFKGLGGGLLGGAAGAALGGYIGGDWGALAGGFASSSIASAFQYDSFQEIHWGNVLLNGVCGAAIGFSSYHAATAYSYHKSGLRSTLSYKQYNKLIRITQRSMMTKREAKFVAYSDGSSISRLGSAHSASSEGISYENAIFDYHTHPTSASALADGEGFSTYQSASDVLGDGRKSDEYARTLLTRKGYKNPMYLGTREGHFWYMNSGGSGTRGMVNNFDHSFVFFYNQSLFMMNFFSTQTQ
jgi:RHS repeat-associated protein